MPTIILQHQLIIDSSNLLNHFSTLLKSSLTSVRESRIFGMLPQSNLKSWKEFKEKHVTIVKQVDDEITSYSNQILRSYRPVVQDMPGRNFLSFINVEAEIYDTNANDVEAQKLALFFISKPYKLLSNFGSCLLLSDSEKKEGMLSAFMIEVNPALSIHSYNESH